MISRRAPRGSAGRGFFAGPRKIRGPACPGVNTNLAGVKHKGPEAFSRHPGTEEELRKLAEGGEEAVWRLEEFVDGELDTMWVSAEKEEACTGFCNTGSVSHSFSMLFPMFRGG